MKTLTSNLSKAGLLAALVIVTTSASVFAQAAASTNAPPFANSDEPAFKSDEVLVKFRGDVTDEQIASAFRGASLQLIKQIQTPVMRGHGDIGITRALTKMPVQAAVNVLSQLPGIEFAQPNWIYRQQDVSNDPYFLNGSLWGVYGGASSPANDFGSHAAEAWAAGDAGSKGVYIGIIDTGIQHDHPDLAGNMWVNLAEQNGKAGTDDDLNGYIDDIYGWNAIAGNGNIYEPADKHGTHVAGTIGALGGNATGVVGVNWTVNIISGKFIGADGSGTTVDAVEAIDYMINLKSTKGLNIVALNNSWGGGAYDTALFNAIVRAAQAEILFVAAAGNGDWLNRAVNTDRTPFYPACYNTATAAGYDAVISVTAIDSKGAKPSWANYGTTTVDLGAPGVGIISTYPGNGYASNDGTSMATPHVTGAIALYAAKYPGAKASSIKKALIDSTTGTPSLTSTVTKGRLDVVEFLAAVPDGWVLPSSPPAAPSGLSAVAISHTQIQLTWTDNSGNEINPINETKFDLTRTGPYDLNSVPGSTTPQVKISLPANVTSYTDANLEPSKNYTYSIQACNTIGCSAAASPAEETTLPPPLPTTATFKGLDTTTQGLWGTALYGAEGYDICKDFSGSYIAGLGSTVSASGAGRHWWENSTSDPRDLTVPGGPGGVAACYYLGGTFALNISLPYWQTHRMAVYCMDWDRQGRQQTIEVLDADNTTKILDSRSTADLGDGKYLIWEVTGPVVLRVTWKDNPASTGDNAIINAVFFGAPQDARVSIPFVPAGPSRLSATASSSQVRLDWTAGSPTTGPVVGYKIERSLSESSGFVEIARVGKDVVTHTDTGLSPSTAYWYRIAAYNEGSDSQPWLVSATTTVPPTVPAAPSGLIASALSKSQIKLAWTDNSSNETGFKIERSRNGTSFSQIALVGAGVTTYTDSGLARATTYSYRVRATNAAGNSGYSNTAKTTTLR